MEKLFKVGASYFGKNIKNYEMFFILLKDVCVRDLLSFINNNNKQCRATCEQDEPAPTDFYPL